MHVGWQFVQQRTLGDLGATFHYYCFVLELKWKVPSGGSFPKALQKIQTLSLSPGFRRLGPGEGF